MKIPRFIQKTLLKLYKTGVIEQLNTIYRIKNKRSFLFKKML